MDLRGGVGKLVSDQSWEVVVGGWVGGRLLVGKGKPAFKKKKNNNKYAKYITLNT